MPKPFHKDELSAIEKAISMVQLPPDSGIITLDELQAQHEHERKLACKQLDEMAKQFSLEDAERKRLWGNKYPPILGAKPPETEPINRVKKTAKKRKKR